MTIYGYAASARTARRSRPRTRLYMPLAGPRSTGEAAGGEDGPCRARQAAQAGARRLIGADLRPRPLFERKGALRRLLRRAEAGIHFVDHLEGDGAKVFAHACELGLEGIVSKDRTRSYRSGRVKHWLKIKNPQAPGVTRFEDRDAPA